MSSISTTKPPAEPIELITLESEPVNWPITILYLSVVALFLMGLLRYVVGALRDH